jgi:hypothetical protein
MHRKGDFPKFFWNYIDIRSLTPTDNNVRIIPIAYLSVNPMNGKVG